MKVKLAVALALLIAVPAIAGPGFLVALDPTGEIGPRVLELEKVVGSFVHMQVAENQERDKRIQQLEKEVLYIQTKPINQLQRRILRLEAKR